MHWMVMTIGHKTYNPHGLDICMDLFFEAREFVDRRVTVFGKGFWGAGLVDNVEPF